MIKKSSQLKRFSSQEENTLYPRVYFLFALIILFGTAIICRLFYLQVVRGDFYRALAQGQQNFFNQFQGERGEIFYNDGTTPLAINVKQSLVYASPRECENKPEVAKILAGVLNLDEEQILEKLENEDSSYQLLKKRLTAQEVSKLKELNLSGIRLGEESTRVYPQQNLASQVIGFLGGEGKGQYGIEENYNDILQGKEGFEVEEKIFGGSLIPALQNYRGSDLILTLDYNTQFRAEQLLKENQERLNYRSGQIIVMEPATGKILAMANFPDFDPNNYSDVSDFKIFQNATIQKKFEPGSVFKPITMAGALEEGVITPQTTYIDEGFVQVGGDIIHNYSERAYGEQTMTGVLEKSINTGAVFAESRLGHLHFLDYISRFGIFEPTQIDLAGEIYSLNEELKKGYEINYANASFGQGIEMTSLQLARAFSAIANGGKLVKPYLVEKIIENDKIIEIKPVIEESEIISPKTASQLTAMMVSVVENGFGKRAKVPGYYIAGKTGTAQISWPSLGKDKRGYSQETWQSFVGWFPAFDPQFLILVKLDNPQIKTAEYSAVPIFHDLAKYILDYYQIPSDYE
jgi:cell division protein FtsI/penicillin-binding protein 2